MEAAPAGPRRLLVDPERLERWVAGFAERHGALRVAADPEWLRLDAADGSTAELRVPFPPLPPAAEPTAAAVLALREHAERPRRLGVLLVRLGGFAVGVFDGDTPLASKVGSRPVHGRAAAGGWSQQRFARRREGQARVALEAAADHAARLLLPHADGLDALVAGGDRQALDAVLADPRLAPLLPRLSPHRLDAPTPDRRLLLDAPRRARAVAVRLREAPPAVSATVDGPGAAPR